MLIAILAMTSCSSKKTTSIDNDGVDNMQTTNNSGLGGVPTSVQQLRDGSFAINYKAYHPTEKVQYSYMYNTTDSTNAMKVEERLVAGTIDSVYMPDNSEAVRGFYKNQQVF